jgi:hypothetical protein
MLIYIIAANELDSDDFYLLDNFLMIYYLPRNKNHK